MSADPDPEIALVLRRFFHLLRRERQWTVAERAAAGKIARRLDSLAGPDGGLGDDQIREAILSYARGAAGGSRRVRRPRRLVAARA